MKWN